jgi:plasmid maintenance system antidote protein VapI
MPIDDEEFERRASRLKRAGEILFGEGRWQSPLAELLGVSQPTVAKIHGGSKDLSPDLEDRLGQLCIDQAEALSRRSIELARLAIEIAGERRLGMRRLQRSPAQQERDQNEADDAALLAERPSSPKPLPRRPRAKQS